MIKRVTVFFFAIVVFLGCPIPIHADSDVDYRISQYEGFLTIHDDNSADFVQKITYQFDSSYNGQIVTLGRAGNMPAGFSIDSDPVVSATVNGHFLPKVYINVFNLGDGYQVKIYNSGSSGDTVEVRVHWKLRNLLFPYSDVAELNWVPISDWDQSLEKVNIAVSTDRSTSNRRLWAHMGYLNSTTVTETFTGYQISAEDVTGKLELHAYWDSSIFNGVSLLPKNRKSAILRQEIRIASMSLILQGLLLYILPIAALILIVGSLVRFNKIVKLAKRYEHLDKTTRSYEVPEDWSPLLVLKYIYDVDLQNLTTQGSPIPQKFNFERVIQATLLDLIDRKAISVDDKTLTCHLDVPMTDYEVEVVDMAFGGKEEILIDDLFADYRFDTDLVKQYKKQYKGEELERKLNKLGSDFNRRYKLKLSKITKGVEEELSQKGLPLVREKSETFTKKITNIQGVSCLGFILLVIVGIYLIFQINLACFIYGALLVFNSLSSFYITTKSKYFTTHGTLTAEGQQRVQEWVSFTNMMRDINKFDKVDIQGVLVWNRILVYATLFGYAKRVQKYLDFHDIKLANESVVLTNSNLGAMIGVHTHQLGLSGHSADSAAHFSVSSGSSGSSGGFSGGGGGGGGGAF